MKLTKLALIFFLACSLQLAACSRPFAAGEDIIVSGDTRANTLRLADADLPATGTEGEIRYKSADKKLYTWDNASSTWRLLSANKNVATKIVGTKNLVDSTKKSLDYSRADYICDGTNDQTEINDAITAITTQAINPSEQGVIYLLDGTYNITGSINIADNNISLIGSGRSTVLRVAGGSDTEVIDISSSSGVSEISGILLSQFTIDGNNKTGSYDGILLVWVTNSRISNILIDSVNEDGLDIDGCSNNTITGNVILNCEDEGMDIEANTVPEPDVPSSNNIISDNIVSGCGGEGIDAGSFIGGVISNNVVMGNATGADGFYGGIRIATNSSGNVVSSNTLLNNVRLGIDCAGYRNVISGNNVNTNGSAGGDDTDDGIRIGGGYNTVFNNSVFGNDDDGISLSGSNNLIFGNSIYDNTNDGISVGASNNILSANYIANSSSPRTGINITAGSNNYLASNEITTSTKIADSGTGTIYTGKEKITLEQTRDDNGASIRSDASYVQIRFAGINNNITVENGKAPGDILVIEGHPTGGTLEFKTAAEGAANIKLCSVAAHNPGSNHPLMANDTLVLAWHDEDSIPNSGNEYWLELSYSNN